MSHRTHHGHLADLHTEAVFGTPALWGLAALGALCIALALLGGCAPTHTQPPPYGILTYDHTHHETLDADGKITARDCHTHAEGGLEAATAALQGQSCGDTIGTTAAGIEAFQGQAVGAPLYLAKIQGDAARDQAIAAGAFQLGGQAACLGMLGAAGASAGIALPAAAAACLQALKGITPTKPVPPPPPVVVPPVVVVPPPPPPPPKPPGPHPSLMMLEASDP